MHCRLFCWNMHYTHSLCSYLWYHSSFSPLFWIFPYFSTTWTGTYTCILFFSHPILLMFYYTSSVSAKLGVSHKTRTGMGYLIKHDREGVPYKTDREGCSPSPLMMYVLYSRSPCAGFWSALLNARGTSTTRRRFSTDTNSRAELARAGRSSPSTCSPSSTSSTGTLLYFPFHCPT